MFTGIIQTIGKIVSVAPNQAGRQIAIDLGGLAERPALGGSVAINGVCLSVVKLDGPLASFDVVPETLMRTNLGGLGPGSPVNIELPLRANDRLDGHFVLGHVDTTARIVEVRPEPPGKRLVLEPDDQTVMRYVVPKGFVAVDGISLTVAEVDRRSLQIAIIPDTIKRTTIQFRRPGDRVNLEADVLVKAVVRQQQLSRAGDDQQLMDTLRQAGFAADNE
jgi:riboflavin synthase